MLIMDIVSSTQDAITASSESLHLGDAVVGKMGFCDIWTPNPDLWVGLDPCFLSDMLRVGVTVPDQHIEYETIKNVSMD